MNDTPTSTVEDTVGDTAVDTTDDGPVAEEQLVEEVSIDGMCGVY